MSNTPKLFGGAIASRLGSRAEAASGLSLRELFVSVGGDLQVK